MKRAGNSNAWPGARPHCPDLHDDLGSSLPDFAVGSLRQATRKTGPGDLHAGKLSESADQTVRALEENRLAVRPAAIRCRAWSNTSRTLRMRRSRTIPPVAA